MKMFSWAFHVFVTSSWKSLMNNPIWAQSFEPSAAFIAMKAVRRMNIIINIENINPKDRPIDCWDFLGVG